MTVYNCKNLIFVVLCKCMVTHSWKITNIVSCGYAHSPLIFPFFSDQKKIWSFLSTRHIKVTNWELLTGGLIGKIYRLCWTSANNLAYRFKQGNRCGGGTSEGMHGIGRAPSLSLFKLQVEQQYDKKVRTDALWKYPLVEKKSAH